MNHRIDTGAPLRRWGLRLAACALAPMVTLGASAATVGEGSWLAGDLHVHSNYSTDASYHPVSELIDLAQRRGLGFMLVSDHDNHVNGDLARNTWADADFVNSPLLMLYGAEWTTSLGHASVWSATPYDHQQLYAFRDNPGTDAELAAVIQRLGVHFSVNHPASGKNPWARSYSLAQSLEVWQSSVWPARFSANELAFGIWLNELSKGRRLTARGGSDSHHSLPNKQGLVLNVGTPTTWAWTSAGTKEALISAIDAGRVSISANPYSPRAEFSVDLDGDGRPDAMMGDNPSASGREAAFTVELQPVRPWDAGDRTPSADYVVKVYKNGQPFKTLDVPGPVGYRSAQAVFTDTPAARDFYLVVVEGNPSYDRDVPLASFVSGHKVAITNPIYFDFPQ